MAADQPVQRRNQREHPQSSSSWCHAPNQMKLLGPTKWTYFYLYVVDISAATGRLDGRRPGELGAGRSSHRRDLPQTGRPAPGAHPALRPRRADDEQVHRTTARRLGVTRLSRPQVCSAQFKTEVPPRLPWASTTSKRSSLGTTPNIAMAGSRCSPRTTCITIEPRACWSSAGGPFKPPGPVIPNASFEGSHNRIPFPKPSGSTHLRHPQQEKLLGKSQSSLSQSR